MSMYILQSDSEKFATVHGVSREDRKATRPFVDLGKVHEPIQLEVVDESKSSPLGDFPNLGVGWPICLSGKARNYLSGFLEAEGMLKKASILGVEDEFFLFWPTSVVDCLDDENTLVEVTPSGYERLLLPVINSSQGGHADIFLVPRFKNDFVFVSKKLADVMVGSDLKGFCLRTGLFGHGSQLHPQK